MAKEKVAPSILIQQKLNGMLHWLHKQADNRVSLEWAEFHRFLLTKGEFFLARKLPGEYPAKMQKWCVDHRPQHQNSFQSTRTLVADFAEKGMTYYEGYSFDSYSPNQCAWVVLSDGYVCDISLQTKMGKYQLRKRKTVYFGVPLPLDAITKYLAKYAGKHSERHERYLFANLHYLKSKELLPDFAPYPK